MTLKKTFVNVICLLLVICSTGAEFAKGKQKSYQAFFSQLGYEHEDIARCSFMINWTSQLSFEDYSCFIPRPLVDCELETVTADLALSISSGKGAMMKQQFAESTLSEVKNNAIILLNSIGSHSLICSGVKKMENNSLVISLLYSVHGRQRDFKEIAKSLGSLTKYGYYQQFNTKIAELNYGDNQLSADVSSQVKLTYKATAKTPEHMQSGVYSTTRLHKGYYTFLLELNSTAFDDSFTDDKNSGEYKLFVEAVNAYFRSDTIPKVPNVLKDIWLSYYEGFSFIFVVQLYQLNLQSLLELQLALNETTATPLDYNGEQIFFTTFSRLQPGAGCTVTSFACPANSFCFETGGLNFCLCQPGYQEQSGRCVEAECSGSECKSTEFCVYVVGYEFCFAKSYEKEFLILSFILLVMFMVSLIAYMMLVWKSSTYNGTTYRVAYR